MEPRLARLESYYDTAPRAGASVVETGPFTLFVADADLGHPYYARPRLGLSAAVTRRDVERLREHQRRLGVPETLEWVHETTPSLLAAARESGLEVEECPLLVLTDPAPGSGTVDVRLLGPDDDLATAHGAVHAGFGSTDEVRPSSVGRRPDMMRRGLLATAAAYDDEGAVVGGGSHSPRGATTELTGIAVLPRARRQGVGTAITTALARDALDRGVGTVFLSAQDDAVARVYERVGFRRVGTACIAAPSRVTSDVPSNVPSDVTGPGAVARLLGPDDWQTWRAVRLRALADSPAAFGSTLASERDQPASFWRERLGNPDGVTVLAEAAGEPAGMGAGFQDLPGLLHVVAMWVAPATRRRGVAGLVLDALRDWARARDLRLHLDVETTNAPARRCYEAYGFVATGESRPIREGSADLVERMVLR